MSASTPIWWCIVQQEPIAPSMMAAYRIIKAYKCELGDIDALYQQHYDMLNGSNPPPYKMTMLFHREPEETPIKDKVNRDDELRQSIFDLRDTVALLERRLNQELTWKDQLAEDNRLLREKLGIPDTHDKFSTGPHKEGSSVWDI